MALEFRYKPNLKVACEQIKEEFDPFLDWITECGVQVIIEIGAKWGGTASRFCEVASELVISIDLPGGFAGVPLRVCEWRNAELSRVFSQFRGVLGDSHDENTANKVEGILDGKNCDLLFIDGDHSLEGVAMDFAMYSKFVRPGGWVAFHDINDTPVLRAHGCWVGQFWKALEGEKLEFNVHGPAFGIGVIRV